MEEFYEYLQGLGINEPPDVFEVIPKLSTDEIIKTSIECYTLTETSAPRVEEKSVFNFSASTAVSGGIYPCSDVNCRVRNVYEMAAFSALYADKIIIPNPFEHIYHNLTSDFDFENAEQFLFFVDRLVGDIVVMLNLRPLIRAGILTINPQLRTFCKSCWAQHLGEQKKISKRFDEIKKSVIDDLNKNIQFVLDTEKSVITRGTENYLGSEVIRFAILPKHLRPFKKSIPHTFTPEEVEELGLWEPFIVPIFEDIILQKLSMENLNTAYITNRGIEADIISHLEPNATTSGESREKAIIEGLVHNLPFVENASLSTLVNVREQEAEAFAVYRDAVRKTLLETKDETSSKAIKDIVEDNIKPQLNKIDQVMKSHKEDFQARGKREIIFDTLLFSAGLFANKVAGIDFSTIFEIGGAYKLSEIYGNLSAARQIPLDVKNSDYYFLWKLAQQS